ncbi:sulfotransferase family 2 domain-containing protein [Acidisoma cellulosilytica]|uniref:Sulfotransferase family 2 domain-containing protein n=1 Tax=Acidisoma cellulosilyticum TaxID=2802395 RepID=A0A964E4L7_9PROT|nr:sulfotransferase family 2 domain-containing protein [Acidisoma cellulosilyticum]MCB8881835.1 sulfotransferase family 2 domain-containing protein [Acidisoma cellulosilyticum]
MIVSHARKFIFFHNPKCAGTSFRDMLKPYHDDGFTFWGVFRAPYFKNHIDHTHLRLWEMQAQFPDIFACAMAYNSVIFVRNPYERFLSAVNEHMKKFQPQIDLSSMTPAQRVEAVETFIRQILTVARITSDWRFIHFSPQIWYLQLGNEFLPRHVIPMGGDDRFMREAMLCLGLDELPIRHHNVSPSNLGAALTSSVLTDFVQRFYEDDFAYFKADARLAGLAELPNPPERRDVTIA